MTKHTKPTHEILYGTEPKRTFAYGLTDLRMIFHDLIREGWTTITINTIKK